MKYVLKEEINIFLMVHNLEFLEYIIIIEFIMIPLKLLRLFRFLSGASRNMTLSACRVWVFVGGKKATGVRPAGTNPAATAWRLPAAGDEEKAVPPPTKIITERSVATWNGRIRILL